MAVCPNCKKSLSCGCQLRKASNGTGVCTNCITKYETNLKVLIKPMSNEPKHISVQPQVWGKDRYLKNK